MGSDYAHGALQFVSDEEGVVFWPGAGAAGGWSRKETEQLIVKKCLLKKPTDIVNDFEITGFLIGSGYTKVKLMGYEGLLKQINPLPLQQMERKFNAFKGEEKDGNVARKNMQRSG